MAIDEFVINMHARRVNITGDVLIENAKRIHVKTNEKVADADKS